MEELTGAVRWSRRFEDRESEGVASATTAGSGSVGAERRTATARSGHRDSTGRRTLPDFFVDGYEAAVRRAKDDIKVLMVVLTCDEHQDDEEFKRWASSSVCHRHSFADADVLSHYIERC